ncbi:hypothetical protein JX266_008362 [Neoarthrinium moseri]|nr:hypothetical protein JX266_008362 [Neoarthrinium moseri]
MGSVKRARSVSPPDEPARELRLRRRVDECDQSLDRKLDSFICHEDCIPEQTVLDVDGDLIIIVGTIACQRLDNAAYHHSLSAAAFRVRSSTVTGNSAVLKDIIHQNMKRLNTTGAEWIAQFPEDKVDPWSAALHIMHGQFDKAPELKCHLLVGVFHLTALCRKYDLLHLLRPWATQFTGLGQNFENQPYVYNWYLSQIFWSLGYSWGFQKAYSELPLLVTYDPSIPRTFSNPYQLRSHCAPRSRLLETTGRHRLQYLQALLDPLRDSVDCLITRARSPANGIACRARYPYQMVGECNKLLLGSLLQSLSDCGLWPVPDPRTVRDPVATILNRIRGLVLFCAAGHQGFGCNSILAGGGVRWVPGRPQLILTDFQNKILHEHAKKTGLDSV